MRIIVGEKEKNLELVKKFKETLYWMPEYRDFYSDDFTLDLPYAPPGWIQNMKHSETIAHLTWMSQTLSNWKWEEGKLYSTNFPDMFWIIREGEGDIDWIKYKGHYKSRFLTRIQVKDGKICNIKDHFDNYLLYKSLGIELPVFDYDGPDPANFKDWEKEPDLTHDPKLMAENNQRAVATFVNVEFWEESQYPIYTQTFAHELPFTPYNMPRRYVGKEYDALNEYLQLHTHDWVVHEGTVLYETDEEGEYIIESAGHGFMTWSHSGGGVYQNRHVSWLKMVDGYATDYYEYFNPLNKFNSMGVSVPSIPYLQGWDGKITL